MKKENFVNLLNRIKRFNYGEEVITKFLNLPVEVLERLQLIKDDNTLELALELLYNKEDYSPKFLLSFIDALELKPKYIPYICDIASYYEEENDELMINALQNVIKAKKEFQAEYIDYLYDVCINVPALSSFAEIILKCHTKYQAKGVYDLVANSVVENLINVNYANIYQYVDVAEIISRAKNQEVIEEITNIMEDNSLKLESLGALSSITKIMVKAKRMSTANHIGYFLERMAVSNIEEIFLAAQILIKYESKDEDNRLFYYLANALDNKDKIDLERVEVIISVRHNFNSKNINDVYYSRKLANLDLQDGIAYAYHESRKDYNANNISDYMKKLPNELEQEEKNNFLAGLSLINEAETEKKASIVKEVLSNFIICSYKHEVEIAALVNECHKTSEMIAILEISKNKYLNEKNLVLILSRIIAKTTDYQIDIHFLKKHLDYEKDEDKLICIFNDILLSLPKKMPKNIVKGIANIFNSILIMSMGIKVKMPYQTQSEEVKNEENKNSTIDKILITTEELGSEVNLDYIKGKVLKRKKDINNASEVSE